jgi:hypothetical protein
MGDELKKSDGWKRYELYVINTLAEMRKGQAELTELVQQLRGDILILKVKAGIWGLIGAMIPTIGAILFLYLTNR